MRQLLTIMVLLLGAAWAAAQSYPSQTSPSTSSNPSASSNSSTPSSQASTGTQSTSDDSGKQTQAVGCLSGSDGNYTLTSSDGKTYQLTGDTSQLKEHVGHKVQITGQVLSGSPSSSANSSSTSSGSSNSDSSTQSTLSVSSIKHMSDTCNAKQSSSSY